MLKCVIMQYFEWAFGYIFLGLFIVGCEGENEGEEPQPMDNFGVQMIYRTQLCEVDNQGMPNFGNFHFGFYVNGENVD